MALMQFKKDVRTLRGQLSNMDKYLDNIYFNGIPELKDMCFEKQMGIKWISDLTNLSFEEQYEFYDWLKCQNYTLRKRDIDLKLSEILDRSM